MNPNEWDIDSLRSNVVKTKDTLQYFVVGLIDNQNSERYGNDDEFKAMVDKVFDIAYKCQYELNQVQNELEKRLKVGRYR